MCVKRNIITANVQALSILLLIHNQKEIKPITIEAKFLMFK